MNVVSIFCENFRHKFYFNFFLGLGFYIALLSSCTTHKNLLQVQSSNNKELEELSLQKNVYLLQEGDIISIKVSSLDPQSVAIFNKTIGQSNNTQVTESAIYLNSYIIEDSGTISLPVIGKIKISGLSIERAQLLLSEKLEMFYKFSSVDLKLMSFRVTVLGEVSQQGTFVIYNTSANILQVIGLAGGVTDMGDRERVRLIRKNQSTSTLTYINLYSDQLVTSEYYQLQPNDIIYVEPLPVKAKRLNLPAIQASLSALAFIVVVLTFIKSY